MRQDQTLPPFTGSILGQGPPQSPLPTLHGRASLTPTPVVPSTLLPTPPTPPSNSGPHIVYTHSRLLQPPLHALLPPSPHPSGPRPLSAWDELRLWLTLVCDAAATSSLMFSVQASQRNVSCADYHPGVSTVGVVNKFILFIFIYLCIFKSLQSNNILHKFYQNIILFIII